MNHCLRALSLCIVVPGLLVTGFGCSRSPVVRETPPYESLVMVAAEFQRCRGTDLYRHPVPSDISGQNVFRATLERLEYYESNNPGRDSDIVSFLRGEALARLGDFRGAARALRLAAAGDGASTFGLQAANLAERYARIDSALDSTLPPANLKAYLDELEARNARLQLIEREFGGSIEASLVRREIEKVHVEQALVLFRNRYVIENGAIRAVDHVESMLEQHASSRLVQSHRLMLGEFRFELARDMVRLTPPDRAAFDPDLFFGLINAARRDFMVVSQADGYAEKPEGAALALQAESFAESVRNMLR